ncbi:DUF1028 domain-containing protein [Rubrobacter indicoceani]|uniref:DUF1028 domain-containing protein n=1 Tax=Rubrobacter indicoceani TaxID=2051957 RepID=UPI000E5B73A0|nr:DUF1028 domain-containing protein [Rubrobacter indicoceani]
MNPKLALEYNTFSIAAHDPESGMFGIATSTKTPAVGAMCVYARAGVGAVVTQARTNPLLGIDGIDLLEKGYPAEDAISMLLHLDLQPERRQLLIVDSEGHCAAHTGDESEEWRGHLCGRNHVVGGNLLVGQRTVEAMSESFTESEGSYFPGRLLLALEAGQAAGGDRRGRQSAALYVVRDTPYPYLDLRVDEHPEPVAELRRIYGVVRKDLVPFIEALPTRGDTEGFTGEDIRGTLIPED